MVGYGYYASMYGIHTGTPQAYFPYRLMSSQQQAGPLIRSAVRGYAVPVPKVRDSHNILSLESKPEIFFLILPIFRFLQIITRMKRGIPKAPRYHSTQDFDTVTVDYIDFLMRIDASNPRVFFQSNKIFTKFTHTAVYPCPIMSD
jgi:hypothetical protein